LGGCACCQRQQRQQRQQQRQQPALAAAAESLLLLPVRALLSKAAGLVGKCVRLREEMKGEENQQQQQQQQQQQLGEPQASAAVAAARYRYRYPLRSVEVTPEQAVSLVADVERQLSQLQRGVQQGDAPLVQSGGGSGGGSHDDDLLAEVQQRVGALALATSATEPNPATAATTAKSMGTSPTPGRPLALATLALSAFGVPLPSVGAWALWPFPLRVISHLPVCIPGKRGQRACMTTLCFYSLFVFLQLAFFSSVVLVIVVGMHG
jgi:hypothetical protein